jgi:hypothetical protein
MAKKFALEWTVKEFDILLQNPTLSDFELGRLLSGRSKDAIQIVRSGIHEYHKKGDSTLLSIMMKDRLAQVGANRMCPICKEPVSTSN